MEYWNDKKEFKDRILFWVEKIKVTIKKISFRKMKNKWASYSTKGSLNINIELLHYDKDTGDYVIVHELLHYHVPNHGKLWKSLMSAYLGDYEKIEKRLKESKLSNSSCNMKNI